ncbi:AMP-binding protein [Chitinimonas sp. BJYL2]|uniref:AMP-binding protein n=1 Tax=Chitinimonas sp. BJYL2 TaxID=2976696 RepID=UPI0022B401B5|nr:AMP-binding protein [Chitinimonas sp. BJYL2]
MQAVLNALQGYARLQPGTVALAAGSESLSYAALAQRVSLLADWLRAAKLRAPVAWLADNGPDWVVLDLALAQAGIAALPVAPFFSEAQRQHVLADSGAGWLISQDPRGQPLPGVHLYAVPLPDSSAAAALPAGTVKLTYTSGTTGTPKGVCLSGTQLDATLRALDEAIGPIKVARHLCTMPLAVLLENLAGVYLPLLRGVTIELPPLAALGMQSFPPDVPMFIAALQQSAADSLILLPSTLQWLVAATASGQLNKRWRFLAVGGGKTARATLQQAEKLGLPVFEGYGLSEAGSVVALNRPGAQRRGSVGKPLSHVSVSLAEDGEVMVAGNAMLGYLGHGPSPALIATGDLGEFDADGYLTILGRKKHTIVTGMGRNVSPEWLEAEFTAIPGVRQAFVYGDEASGLHALFFCTEPLAANIALARANDQLPAYARLDGWLLIDTPFSPAQGEITPNGRLCRERILANRLPLLQGVAP